MRRAVRPVDLDRSSDARWLAGRIGYSDGDGAAPGAHVQHRLVQVRPSAASGRSPGHLLASGACRPPTLAGVPRPTGMGRCADSSSATQAQQLRQYLPGFTYNLTSEAPSIRAGICSQQVSYCSISGCADTGSTVSTNFCNNQVRPWRRDPGSRSRRRWAGTVHARAERRGCSTGNHRSIRFVRSCARSI